MTGLNRIVTGWNGRASDELARLFTDSEGQDVIEYALLTAFIGFAGAGAWAAMRTSLGVAYTGFAKGVWDSWTPADPKVGP